MAIIDVRLSSVICSNHPELNLVTPDFGEEVASFNSGDAPHDRLKGLASSVVSPKIYTVATITASVLKTSPNIVNFFKQIQKNSSLTGSVTFVGDRVSNEGEVIELTLLNPTIELGGDYSGSGQEASVSFVFTGDWLVNNDLLI